MRKIFKISEEQLKKYITFQVNRLLKGLYQETDKRDKWVKWRVPGREGFILGHTLEDPDTIYYDGTYFNIVYKLLGAEPEDISISNVEDFDDYYDIFREVLSDALKERGIKFKKLM